MEDTYIALSALQHYAYCPRQCALIHIEQVWTENFWTAEGRLLHERIDGGESEQRRNIRYERSVAVVSHRLRIAGKLDLLEIKHKSSQKYFPIEYKRGKPKLENWDRVQLCAQALCLEEMRDIQINEGALWYWQTRHREAVFIDEDLRRYTENIIASAWKMIQSGTTPQPIFNKRCKACSLIDWCEPSVLQNDHSVEYMNKIFAS